jgi:hypothetical protein
MDTKERSNGGQRSDNNTEKCGKRAVKWRPKEATKTSGQMAAKRRPKRNGRENNCGESAVNFSGQTAAPS